MLSLLFNTSFWYDVLLAICIIVIVIACVKYPQGRIYVFTFLGVAMVALTSYCCIQLNYYYTAEGGIIGKIHDLFQNNTVEVEDMTFSLNNIELIQDKDDVYTAQILSHESIKLSPNERYVVFVNNQPCAVNENDNRGDYIIANYTYMFMDVDREVLCTDTLKLTFAFYENSTYLSISTSGGAKAVKYWNYYFNKNTFVVTIAKAQYFSDDISSGNGDVSNVVYAYYHIRDKVYLTQIYHVGENVKLPYPEQIASTFMGWSIDKTNLVGDYVMKQTTHFYAVETQ